MEWKRVILLRHEPTHENLAGIIQGQSVDGRLVESKIDPVKIQWCAERIVYPARILCSSALRAKSSAEQLGDALKISVTPMSLLLQRGWGNVEGQPLKTLSNAFVKNAFLADAEMLAPGAETLQSVRQRADDAWKYINELEVSTIIVITHDEFSNYLINKIFDEGLFKRPLRFNEAHIIEMRQPYMFSSVTLHESIDIPPTQHKVIIRNDAIGFAQEKDGIRILLNRGISAVLEPEVTAQREIEGVIIGDQLFTEDDLTKYPNLKVIARFGKGVDNIRIAPRDGLWITHTPGCNERVVAEFTATLILNLLSHLPQLCRNAHDASVWKRYPRSEWSKIRIGIIGLGATGRYVAEMMRSMGFQIIAWTRHPENHRGFAAANDFVFAASLDDLCQQADIVTVHLPLTAETEGLISHRRFELMKERRAYFVNTSRAAIADYYALKTAIEKDWLRGAAIDVWPEKPISSPWLLDLISNERIIATPHCAGKTFEAFRKTVALTAYNIAWVLNGRPESASCVSENEMYYCT